MSANVLIVDAEESARAQCDGVLRGLGFKTQVADVGPRALAILESGQIDIVLADARLAGLDSLELVKIIKQKYPGVDVVLMAEPGTMGTGFEALKFGAYGYVTKPFRVNEIRHLFQRLVEKQELTVENRLLREQLKAHHSFGSLVGTSEKMQKVYRLILKVAPNRHPVLIQGESGTGKELVARAIHAYSPWHRDPFVPVDCGALAPTLIKSELFGHVRGAFTGATQNRQGLLAAAGSGTVFLDEIAELPIELQVKLLRAFQEREFKPIGSNARLHFEARVIAATNQDLEAAIARGQFRRDLYFRLNVVSIRVPPLRDRKSDISTLVRHFIDRHGGPDAAITGITCEAMTRLMNYEWPGNVRELENSIQRAMVLGSPPQIQVKDLPTYVLNYMVSPTAGHKLATLRELERQAILQALEVEGGDRLRAAKLLGIGKTTIYRKLKQYGLKGASTVPPAA